MPNYAPRFASLAVAYKTFPMEFPQLRAVSLAQWILESGRGFSQLSQQYYNYAGLKYRNEMQGFAVPVFYMASDGGDYYCGFADNVAFIRGFWKFMDRSPYFGWRQNSRTAQSYLDFIAPRYSTNPAYVDKVLNLLPEANQLLGISSQPTTPTPPDDHAGAGTSEPYTKPLVSGFFESPNAESRNGSTISRIILHCSDNPNLAQVITQYQNPRTQRSAHYLVNKDGKIYQMVRDSDRAWHCRGANANSLGVELIAARNEVMTPAQQTSTVALLRWMLSSYRIRPDQISGHRHTPGYTGGVNGTFCPGRLFGDTTDAALKRWVNQNFWTNPPASNPTTPVITNPNTTWVPGLPTDPNRRWDF